MLCRLPLPARQPPSSFQRASVANRTDTGMPPLVAQERRCVSDWQPSSIIARRTIIMLLAGVDSTPADSSSISVLHCVQNVRSGQFRAILMLQFRKCDAWQAFMFLPLGLFMPDSLFILPGRPVICT